MRQISFLIGALLFLVSGPSAYAQQQSDEPPKVEVAVQTTSLIGREIQPFFSVDLTIPINSEAGLGVRFSYNVTKHLALEAEGNVFARGGFFASRDSAALNVQGQFGVKAGKRFERFGVFAKARPGLLSVGDIFIQTGTQTIEVGFPFPPVTFPVFEVRRKKFFTLDVGGVLEFYPSRRVLVRFDAGDTMVHGGDVRSVLFTDTPPLAGTTHNFQFSSGVAFRFRDPAPASGDADGVTSDAERKFEAGVQFSSLRLRLWAETELPSLGFDGEDTQSGFGGWMAYNFTRSIAAEVQTFYFPKGLFSFANGRAGGRIIQVQAGPKLGKRFEKFGVFGKVQPGAVSFSETITWKFGPTFSLRPPFEIERRTHFSLDVGGVLEFYPTPRIVTRFDGGDTIIYYGSTQVPFFSTLLPIIDMQPKRKHQFQFSAGVGFRF